jgi:hypothetical protein
MAVVVPMARSRDGGSEGRRERICDGDNDFLSGKTYCPESVVN